jgi:hypothetical protein
MELLWQNWARPLTSGHFAASLAPFRNSQIVPIKRFPSMKPLVSDSHLDNVTSSFRSLWTIVFKKTQIAQFLNSPACKELQKSDLSASEGSLLSFGNFPWAVRQDCQHCVFPFSSLL